MTGAWRLGQSIIEVVEFGPGECKHHACFHLADSRAFVAADLIYNGAHLYLQEHNLEGWLKRLDEFDAFVAQTGVQTIYPGHGPAGGLSLIEATREYLEAFATAVQNRECRQRSGSDDRALPRPSSDAVPHRLQPPGLLPDCGRRVI